MEVKIYRHCIELITLFLLIIIIGCTSTRSKPGTGGTSYAKEIEKTGHPQVPDGVTCFVCHKEDIPVHEFHINYGNNCINCHDKTSWMARNYAHPAWPLDNVHRTRCTRCHTEASKHDFTSYQCWGCHHEEDNTKKFHAKIGKENITNCIVCHKSTSGDKSPENK